MKPLDKIRSYLRRSLRTHAFLKNVMLLAGGTALSQMIIAASSPLISRMFSPNDIGMLSIYTSLLGMIVPFATMRFELAIPIADDDNSAKHILVLSIVSVIAVSIIVLALSLSAGDALTSTLNAELLRPNLWLLSVGILGAGFYNSILHWGLRKKTYKTIAKTKLNQGIAKVSVQIISGLFGSEPIGLIMGEVLGQAFGIRVLSRTLGSREFFRDIKFETMKSMASRYRRFPLVSSWSALLNAMGLQIPVLILSALYGPSVTGAFGFSQRIVSLPLSLIGVAISQVFFSEGAILSKENPEKLLDLTKRTARKLFFFGLIISAILIPFGPCLFTFVFGDAWRIAGQYSSVLSLMLAFRFAVNPISRALSIIEKQGTQFILDFFRVVLILLTFFASKLLGFSAINAVITFAVSMILVYCVTYSVIIYSLRNYLTHCKIND